MLILLQRTKAVLFYLRYLESLFILFVFPKSIFIGQVKTMSCKVYLQYVVTQQELPSGTHPRTINFAHKKKSEYHEYTDMS